MFGSVPNCAARKCAYWLAAVSLLGCRVAASHAAPIDASQPDAVTPPDAQARDAATPCEISDTSTLPGVHIRFASDTVCKFTLAEVSAGIRIPYTVSVAQDIDGFASDPLDIGGCGIPAPGVFGTFGELAGAGQYYALNDIGGCFGEPLQPGTLRKGTYRYDFEWDGRNWSGPSDTGNQKGQAFPSGIYTLTIRAKGHVGVVDVDAGSGSQFEASATLRVLLTE